MSQHAKSFSNGEVWDDPILVIRDAWDHARGFRIYWAPSADADVCVQVDGEINGEVFSRVGDARFALERRFPGVEIVRWTT